MPNEWEEFKAWKQQNTKTEDTGFDIIPPEERKELIDHNCKHKDAYIVSTRPDGLVDCYCQCGIGGIYKTLEEFKRS